MTARRVARGPWFEELHPGQVLIGAPAVTLTPGKAAVHQSILRARRIVAAAAEHGSGAFRLDGQMLDAPVISRATAVLATATAFPDDRDIRDHQE